jgi:hypothetical protein
VSRGDGGRWPLRLGRAAELRCLSTRRLLHHEQLGEKQDFEGTLSRLGFRHEHFTLQVGQATHKGSAWASQDYWVAGSERHNRASTGLSWGSPLAMGVANALVTWPKAFSVPRATWESGLSTPQVIHRNCGYFRGHSALNRTSASFDWVACKSGRTARSH